MFNRGMSAMRTVGTSVGARGIAGTMKSAIGSSNYKKGLAASAAVAYVSRGAMTTRRSGLDKVVGIPRGMRNY